MKIRITEHIKETSITENARPAVVKKKVSRKILYDAENTSENYYDSTVDYKPY